MAFDLQSAETRREAVIMTKQFTKGMQRLLGPALVCWLVGALPLSAQTVTNPRNLEFAPSADHYTTLTEGAGR